MERLEGPLVGAPRDILGLLSSRGALFYDDIVTGSGRLPTDVERGLWDLVARGLVTADGFQALRSLMAATRRRTFRRPQRARLFRTLAVGLPSGRWSVLPTADTSPDVETPRPAVSDRVAQTPLHRDDGAHGESPYWGVSTGVPPANYPASNPRRGVSTGVPASEDLAEAWAEQLLFRYGIVFRDLMQRESVAVPWRDILRPLRRMEARGTVRGGRFVAGFYGEQYARPEAVESLRKVRRTDKTGQLVRVSAVDPLNLVGILTPGPRTTAVHTNAVIYRDGVPLSEEEVSRLVDEARVEAGFKRPPVAAR